MLRLRHWWHSVLCFLRLRNDYDWSAPAWPEVHHYYEPAARSRCCQHCGGGRFHGVHDPPYDTGRLDQIAIDRIRRRRPALLAYFYLQTLWELERRRVELEKTA